MDLLNKPAPNFKLKTHKDEEVTLEEFKGKKNVLLIFYPLDFSPVCTIQLPEYSSMKDEFAAVDTVVLGINRDSVWSHKAWAEEYMIKVPLLSDMTLETARKYGVAIDEAGISQRATFLIDKQGKVILQHIETSPGDFSLHAEEVLEKIKELKQQA